MAAGGCACETTTYRGRCAAILFELHRLRPAAPRAICLVAFLAGSHPQLALADLIILPGSKQTVQDLLWMRRQDMDSCVVAHAAQGLVVGICGGMQMLGTAIVDSLAMEHGDQADGLGLLPFATRMNPDKVTRLITGRLSPSMLFGQPAPAMHIDGYEIHIGENHVCRRRSGIFNPERGRARRMHLA
jgi:cobyric acid synthase